MLELLIKIEQAINNPELSDITFIVQEKQIYGHKFIFKWYQLSSIIF
jgi:hypothetical protein